MVDGINELQRRWERVPARVANAVREAMEKAAQEVVRDARRLAPKGMQGDLVRSIGWTWGNPPAGSMVLASSGDAVNGPDGRSLAITIYAGDAHSMVQNARGKKFQNARIQEFGARRGPPGFAGPGMWRQPNPYFFPAWRIWRRRIKVRLSRAITAAIRAA